MSLWLFNHAGGAIGPTIVAYARLVSTSPSWCGQMPTGPVERIAVPSLVVIVDGVSLGGLWKFLSLKES
jgi:hypothetical protein